MPKILYYTIISCCLFLASCGKKTAADYAQQYCNCSEELGVARVQLTNGLITKEQYEQTEQQQEDCMGSDNPLETLKEDPEALATFKASFLIEITKQCPKTAQNMGFDQK